MFPRSFEPVIVETHKDVGVAILLLLAFRLVWRLVRKPPPYRRTARPAMERLAALGHIALYALMVACLSPGSSTVLRAG